MFHDKKNALFLFLVLSLAAPLFAKPVNFTVRAFAGMEPLGRLSASGMGASGADLRRSAGYGFSPGLEAYAILGERVEIGVGARWQALRGAVGSGGDSDERFGFVPVYVAGRLIITEMDVFRLYGTAKAGFGFFRTTSAFDSILAPPDGPLVSVSGGIYLAGGAGVIYTIKERPKWGLDVSLDAGFAFYNARGEDSIGATHRFRYQALTADFALDWRF